MGGAGPPRTSATRGGGRVMTGIRQRHGRKCKGGRCRCPWEAFVYSKRDGKKIYKSFPDQAAAAAWRTDADGRGPARSSCEPRPRPRSTRQQKRGLTAPRQGVIRNRSGDQYKPGADPGLRGSMAAPARARDRPQAADRRKPRVTCRTWWTSSSPPGCAPSTVVVTMLPLRVIYKRAQRARGSRRSTRPRTADARRPGWPRPDRETRRRAGS